MRVRLLQDYRLYWDYAVHELREGAEHVGEFARHLTSTGAPVEVLEHDPEPDPAGELPPEQPLEQPAPVGEDGTLTLPAGLDLTGTMDTVLTWVGEDPVRARQALAVEQAKGDGARATLVGRLQQLADPVQP